MTEKPELEKDAYGDIIEPPLESDYGSKVDTLVDSMGVTDKKESTIHRRKDLDLL